jgi:hypothetical protein
VSLLATRTRTLRSLGRRAARRVRQAGLVARTDTQRLPRRDARAAAAATEGQVLRAPALPIIPTVTWTSREVANTRRHRFELYGGKKGSSVRQPSTRGKEPQKATDNTKPTAGPPSDAVDVILSDFTSRSRALLLIPITRPCLSDHASR